MLEYRCLQIRNTDCVTLIIFIDGEELIHQLRYTDGFVWLSPVRSVCAFTTCWFDTGANTRTWHSFRYPLLLGSVSRISRLFLWWRHYLRYFSSVRQVRIAFVRGRVVGTDFRWKLNGAIRLFCLRRKCLSRDIL